MNSLDRLKMWMLQSLLFQHLMILTSINLGDLIIKIDKMIFTILRSKILNRLRSKILNRGHSNITMKIILQIKSKLLNLEDT